MKFIIGKKIGMTQVWQGDEAVAVTKVQAGPCVVTQVKSIKDDGYEAVQVGYGEVKAKKIKKPQQGHLKETGNFRNLKEFRIKEVNLNRGDVIDVTTFAPGDIVDVIGTSKGKGFQGVVKRHHFHGHNTTHGTKDAVRMPGSIGATGPAHVFKGMRMGGHMGDDRVTTKNLEIVQVDEANGILFIKGSVPGAANSLVLVEGKGELKTRQTAAEKKEEVEVKVEAKKDEDIEEVVIEADEKIKQNSSSAPADAEVAEDKENK